MSYNAARVLYRSIPPCSRRFLPLLLVTSELRSTSSSSVDVADPYLCPVGVGNRSTLLQHLIDSEASSQICDTRLPLLSLRQTDEANATRLFFSGSAVSQDLSAVDVRLTASTGGSEATERAKLGEAAMPTPTSDTEAILGRQARDRYLTNVPSSCRCCHFCRISSRPLPSCVVRFAVMTTATVPPDRHCREIQHECRCSPWRFVRPRGGTIDAPDPVGWALPCRPSACKFGGL